MRITTIIAALIAAFASVNTLAFEAGVMPHAMVYISVPLDSQDTSRDHARFGFRLDNVQASRQHTVNYQQLLGSPAVLDFRVNGRGIEGIYLSGIDYLQLYKVNRQNQEQGNDDVSTLPEEDSALSEALGEAPLGIYIGVGLGIGLLLGVGD